MPATLPRCRCFGTILEVFFDGVPGEEIQGFHVAITAAGADDCACAIRFDLDGVAASDFGLGWFITEE